MNARNIYGLYVPVAIINCILIALTATATSQTPFWDNISITDEYGLVRDITCDSSGTVYFSSQEGIFLSTDNGTTWERTDWTDGKTRYNDYGETVISYYKPVVLQWGLIEYSKNGGKAWLPLYSLHDTSEVPPNLDAGGSGGRLLYPPNGNIWYHLSGVYWYDSVLQGYHDGAAVFHYDTINGKIRKKFHFFPKLNGNVWGRLDMSISDSGNILIGGRYSLSGGGEVSIILRSEDEGITWDTIPAPSARIHSVRYCSESIFASDYEGVYKFVQGKWKKVLPYPALLTWGYRTTLHKKNGHEFFLWLDSTIAYTSDAGDTWEMTPQKMHVRIQCITPNGTLFALMRPRTAATENYIASRSTDNGVTWTPLRPAKQRTLETEMLYAAPSGVVYLANWDIFRTADNGESWQKLDWFPHNSIVSVIEAQDGSLYVSLATGYPDRPCAPDVLAGSCVMRSTDKGVSWIDITPDSLLPEGRCVWVMALWMSPDGWLYARRGGSLLCRSPDGVWSRVVDENNRYYVTTEWDGLSFGKRGAIVAVSGSNMESASDGIWNSTDTGKTWRKLPLVRLHPDDDKSTSPISISFESSMYDPYRNRFIITTLYRDMYPWRPLISTDGGRTFDYLECKPNVLNGILRMDSLGSYYVIDPQGSGGVMRSTDGGATWEQISTPKTGPSGFLFETSRSGYIFAADRNTGVWRSKQRFPPVAVQEEPLPTTQELHIIPNPADGILRWNIPDGTATIINVMGQKMMELPASAQTADVSGLAAGVYVLTVRTTAGIVSRTFVKE